MALKKREILQRVLDEIEPGKLNVAKPQDSEDPDTECILQRKADRKEVKLAIDNTRFRSNNIDDIKNLVESAINFPHLRTAAGAEMENAFPGADRRILGSDSGRGGGIGKIKKQRGTETINGKCPECQKLRRAKREWITQKIYFLVLAPLAFVLVIAIVLPIAMVGGFMIFIWAYFTTNVLRSPRANRNQSYGEPEKGPTKQHAHGL